MHNLTETILLLLLIEIYELNKASLCDDYFYVSVLQRHHLIIINFYNNYAYINYTYIKFYVNRVLTRHLAIRLLKLKAYKEYNIYSIMYIIPIT